MLPPTQCERRKKRERPAADFQYAHECPAAKCGAARWRQDFMIKRGPQALGIVTPCRKPARHRSSTNVVW